MISAAGKAGHQQGIVQSEEVSTLDRVFLRGRCLFKVYISSSPCTIEQIVHMLEKRWSVSSLRTFTQPSVSLLNTLSKKLGKEAVAMKINRMT